MDSRYKVLNFWQPLDLWLFFNWLLRIFQAPWTLPLLFTANRFCKSNVIGRPSTPSSLSYVHCGLTGFRRPDPVISLQKHPNKKKRELKELGPDRPDLQIQQQVMRTSLHLLSLLL